VNELPTYDHIWIAGEKHLLEGVRCVTFNDPDGYSFDKSGKEKLTELFGFRRKEGKKLEKLEDLKKHIDKVIIHTDLCRDAKKCFDILVGRNLSTHFMVDWDGTLYQGTDPMYEAWHAAGVNSTSIGIDMNNLMVNLVREPDAPMYSTKEPIDPKWSEGEFKRPKSKRQRVNGGDVQSYGYTDPQYNTLIKLLKALSQVFDLIKPFPPYDAKREIVFNTLTDFSGFQGFMGHYHVETNRWDPGPGFDWDRVYYGLASEHNSFPVELVSGQNVSTLLEEPKVAAYAEQYYAAIESNPQGGWYPIGKTQAWHGGIHLRGTKGEKIKAMFDGVIVAARFDPKPTAMGSNNFMLLRHDVPIPTGKKDKTKTFTFFSLYMHLGPINWKDPTTLPAWVTKMERVDSGASAAEEEALLDEALIGDLKDDDKKKKKRDKKPGKGKGKDEPTEEKAGGAEEDEELFTEGEDSGEFQKYAYGKLGQTLGHLKKGYIVAFPKQNWEQNPVKVSSGDVLADLGEFGEEQPWDHLLHVEVFADGTWKEAVDMAVHGRFFTEIEGDLGSGSLFVKNREILAVFNPDPRKKTVGSLVPERVLDPGDLEFFFTTAAEGVDEKRWFRRLVTRHVSEWSDQVDWVRSLSSGQTWDDKVKEFREVMKRSGIYRAALKKVLPFVWLSEEVAARIGLSFEKWDGVLYHFHPVHFLMWLTYRSANRIQVVSRGLTLAQLKKRQKEEEAERKKKQDAGERLLERPPEDEASLELADIETVNIQEVLKEWREDVKDQGEWEMPGPEDI
jgi:N-acetyl-anhydromuramyl-L-alanine amidase AmpD